MTAALTATLETTIADRLKAIADQIRSIRIDAYSLGDAVEGKIDAERAVRRLEKDLRALAAR